jgi:ribosomal-protein-alanine N-acetyltransferase
MSTLRLVTEASRMPGVRGVAPRAPVRVEPAERPLRSERLTLRPLAPEDRASFISGIRASRVELDRWSRLHREGESDEALFERQLEMAREGERTGNAVRRVALLDDGTVAGAFNLNAIRRGLEATADVNWWIVSPLAGRGLATEGVRLLVEHATEDLPHGLGLHAIEAGIRRDNVASVRVAEKVGFARLDRERTHLHTGDRWVLHDIYTYRVRHTSA